MSKFEMDWPFGTVIRHVGSGIIILTLGRQDGYLDYRFGDGHRMSEGYHGFGVTLANGDESYPEGETCVIDGYDDDWEVVK